MRQRGHRYTFAPEPASGEPGPLPRSLSRRTTFAGVTATWGYLTAINRICFQVHSRFVPSFPSAFLCFHRHSRFVPSVLVIALLVSFAATNLLSVARKRTGVGSGMAASRALQENSPLK